MKYLSLSILLFFLWSSVFAQTNLSWHNPKSDANQAIEGQYWPTEVSSTYHRLPSRAKASVSDDVWWNSTHSAGVMIRFRTNSSSVRVRYQTKKRVEYGMFHMPSTGVSGVDLYAKDSDGKELWCKANTSFRDTIFYNYDDLVSTDRYHNFGHEFRLYLPLYNEVEWLEIGVQEGAKFEFLGPRQDKSIVVYGTSIAHGACASRPGMAWTSIVGRELDRPLFNFGFSGSGRLDSAMIDLIAEIDAKVYILDCLPNLTERAWVNLGITSADDLQLRIIRAVKRLKKTQPEIPILLVEHAGYTDGDSNLKRDSLYKNVNAIQKEAFIELKKSFPSGLYYLTKEEISLTQDAMVDGTHPTDLGMVKYANAYEKKLRYILHEKKGVIVTQVPVIQSREPYNYNWENRHNEILSLSVEKQPKSVFIANSIIHFWGGEPRADQVVDGGTWDHTFTPKGMMNLAYGWDRLENVLWRIHHGELDGFHPEKILIMIGTNNLHLNSDEEIIEGLDMILEAISSRQPDSELYVIGLLPRRDYEDRIDELNKKYALLAAKHDVFYQDIGEVFLLENSKIDETLFSDGLHPNRKGYAKLGPLVTDIVDN